MNKTQKVVGAAGIVLALVLFLKGRGAAQLSPADIQISDLVILPQEVQVGQPVTISVNATNIGETAGSYEIILEVV